MAKSQPWKRSRGARNRRRTDGIQRQRSLQRGDQIGRESVEDDEPTPRYRSGDRASDRDDGSTDSYRPIPVVPSIVLSTSAVTYGGGPVPVRWGTFSDGVRSGVPDAGTEGPGADVHDASARNPG